MRKIAQLEKKVKERDSQIEKKEREFQDLKKQGRRGKPHAFQRHGSCEIDVDSSQGSGMTKDHEIRSLKRQLDNFESVKRAGEESMLEISRKDEEIRQLKLQLENTKSAAEGDITSVNEQAKYFEIQYRSETERSQRLQCEVQQLRQQLVFAPLPETDEEFSGSKESCAKIIANLQCRIKQLVDDISKLRQHSTEQSRAILSLRQQAEMAQVRSLVCLNM